LRNPLGYKVLRTYTQGEEIYESVKIFTAIYLHLIQDSRLIGHMNDSARSVPRNIAEGYGRNNTKQYYEFMGFSFGSLLELLEDSLELEKDIKGGLRKTKDNEQALFDLSKIIKLCMG
jgi:four helix bundle protein